MLTINGFCFGGEIFELKAELTINGFCFVGEIFELKA